MIENLLHTQIVLSKSQIADLQDGGVAITEKDNVAGEITLIGIVKNVDEVTIGGVNDWECKVQVLIRIDPDLLQAIESSLSTYPVYCASVVNKVFKREDYAMSVGQDGVERELATITLGDALRNPQSLLRAYAQRLAKAVIHAYHERCGWEASDEYNDQFLDDGGEDYKEWLRIGKVLGLVK